jgi:hypothetical protein
MSPAPASPAPARRASALLVVLLPTVGLLAAGAACWRLAQRVDALTEASARQDGSLQQVLGELTRLRIEQNVGKAGPEALLERLRTYAPLVADARAAQPDYQKARKEIDAVLRAFATIGKDAWQPIQAQLAKLSPDKDHEEIKQLLRASVVVDRDAGVQQLKRVLLGQTLPSPRLRWFAAQAMIEHDRPLAQATLRQVLLTESSTGFNPEYAAMYPGATVPDRAALSQSGFMNFVLHYVRSEDPQQEQTLLQVIGRTGHDVRTLQECVKALGEAGSVRAVPVIENLYSDPPLQQQDPLFMNHCLQALADIQGAGAKPFLEKALPNAPTDIVARKIQSLLAQIADGTLRTAAERQPKREQKAQDDRPR